MTPDKKIIKKFVKLIINDFKKADLRTLKIHKFRNDFIHFDFMIDKQKISYKYTDHIAEKFYNIFLKFEHEIENL
jgi:hypothetical protein